MMLSREFNYIAWHKPTQKMFKVYGISGEYVFEDTLDGIHTSPTNPAYLQDCIILQYSGVFDKSGAQIYEADVIECRIGVCVVEFAKGSFWARNPKTDKRVPLHDLITTIEPSKDIRKKSVIHNVYMPKRLGNIFQHPNLIE